MKIVIDYNSVWRNSFLADSKNDPLERRNFKASSKSKEKADIKEISESTVLGILSRLIGDQRKLYQAQVSEYFYFKDMSISFKEIKKKEKQWIETVTLINKSEGRPSQKSFMGVLNDSEPLFFSEYSATLWSILDYELNELLDFIVNPEIKKIHNTVSPKHILNRVIHEISEMDSIQFFSTKVELTKEALEKELAKDKSSNKRICDLTDKLDILEKESQKKNVLQFEGKLKSSIRILQEEFPDIEYIEKDKSIKPIGLYAGALYLLRSRLEKEGINISPFKTKRGNILGFSKRSFNGARDFLNPLTGNKKKTTHTPYDLTKADGQLEINLDIDLDKAKQLKNMIECAGVSSFYLGKKGLAYVSSISLR